MTLTGRVKALGRQRSKLSLPAHEPILSFKRGWEQRPLPKGCATASAARVADTWACPTKRGKQQPARCSLRLVH
jgi:hypothetical protein